jgi:hypothetical protein
MNKQHECMQWFAYDHLPEHLQGASKPFHELATKLVESNIPSEQLNVAIQKLIECKDAAVRASLYTQRNP